MRGIAALAVLLACACGDDDDAQGGPSSGKDSGAAGQDEPSAGKGGKGGRGGSSAPTAGKGGSAGKGGGGGSAGKGGNVASGPGEFGDYWKRRTVEMTIIDATNPTGFKQETIELPDRIANPVDGRELDVYIQIKDDKRYTYALFEGDQVYYRMTTPLLETDDAYFDSSGGETQIYELEDGVLKDTRITAVDTYSLTSASTYERVAEFPPSDWPAEMLDTVEIAP